MRPETSSREPLSHQAVTELLPWYLNSTLDDGESRAVEAHLDSCDDCRAEVEALRQVAGAVREESPRETRHGDLEAVRQAIDERKILAFRASTPVRWILAAQAAAIVALLAGLLWTTPAADREYRTLSDPAPGQTADSEGIRVVFDPEASEAEIRRLLNGLSAEIVGGPNRAGAYDLRIDSPADASATTAGAMTRLREHRLIRFAGPLTGGAP